MVDNTKLVSWSNKVRIGCRLKLLIIIYYILLLLMGWFPYVQIGILLICHVMT